MAPDIPVKVLVNQKAGNYSDDIVRRIIETLADSRAAPDIKSSQLSEPVKYTGLVKMHPTSDMENLVRESVHSGYRDFILVGGDGTINDYANALIKCSEADGLGPSDFLVSIIPGGSGNDFSRAGLGINGLEESLRIIHDFYSCNLGKRVMSDVIEMRMDDFHRYIINVADASFGAHLSGWVLNHKIVKKLLSANAYSAALFFSFGSYACPDLELEINGEKRVIEDVFMANILNSSDAAGGMYLCPDAQVDDSALDIILASGIRSPPAALLMKAKKRESILGDKHITYISGVDDVIFRAINGTTLGRLIELDGEVFLAEKDMTQIRYTVSGHKLGFLSGARPAL